MEYEQIKKIIEDMSNSKLSSIDIEFPEGTKISMKKDINIQNIVVENKDPSKTEEIKANEEVKGKVVGVNVWKRTITVEQKNHSQVEVEVK